jgi:hypothetical protein
MTTLQKVGALLGVLVLFIAVGVGIGYWWFKPTVVIETAAPEVKQEDGSVIVERKPDATAKPRQRVPKGATVERIERVVVQGETPSEIRACTSVKCPPVTVDLSLVRISDNTKRVLASSPDGQIVSAIDIPVETAAPPPEPPKWAVGMSLDPIRQTPGVWIERDIWRVRAGAEINQVKQRTDSRSSAELRLRLGWTF